MTWWPHPFPEPPEQDDDKPEPPSLEVEVTEPKVLGYLLGPDGEPIATLLDRRVVPFGYQRRAD